MCNFGHTRLEHIKINYLAHGKYITGTIMRIDILLLYHFYELYQTTTTCIHTYKYIYTRKKIPQSFYSHCTISSTTASRGFTLKPLYWLVWQRYEPVISLDTLTIRSTPS